jgi:Ca-activated chloride channel family protein
MKKLSVTVALTALSVFAQPVAAETGSSIALILDASGSMNGKLKDGAVKIDAAKKAVGEVVSKLPADVRLSFRAYGHQSHRSKKNCKDTQLLVDFTPSGDASAPIMEKMKLLKAQGYTPISYVLELAAKDVEREGAGQRSVVLVSDGKETCEGDPCAVAKALAEADAKLVVHTIGFGVDAAAKYQLQCIAKVARGKYFEAGKES